MIISQAIIFEELGVFGLALIIIPYTIIIYRLFSYAYKMKDPKHKIILCGIASYFFSASLFESGWCLLFDFL